MIITAQFYIYVCYVCIYLFNFILFDIYIMLIAGKLQNHIQQIRLLIMVVIKIGNKAILILAFTVSIKCVCK